MMYPEHHKHSNGHCLKNINPVLACTCTVSASNKAEDTQAMDQAIAACHASNRRLVATCDFQLGVIRKALVTMYVGELTAAERYERSMLIGIIDDAVKEPADPQLIHGWVL